MNKEELKKEAEEYIKANNLEWELECYRTSPIGEIKQAYIASAEPRDKRIEELEKENAELKGLKDVATLIRANNDTVTTLMQLNNMLVSKSQQLTKAKEIIKQLLLLPYANNEEVFADVSSILDKAEQFIKENEV